MTQTHPAQLVNKAKRFMRTSNNRRCRPLTGFIDVDNRLAALSKQGDPLKAGTRMVPLEEFRAEIEAEALTADGDK
jgi:hypothetical protein